MLRRIPNDPQMIRDLADAGIISETQKQVALERMRLYSESVRSRVNQLQQQKTNDTPEDKDKTAPQPTQSI